MGHKMKSEGQRFKSVIALHTLCAISSGARASDVLSVLIECLSDMGKPGQSAR